MVLRRDLTIPFVSTSRNLPRCSNCSNKSPPSRNSVTRKKHSFVAKKSNIVNTPSFQCGILELPDDNGALADAALSNCSVATSSNTALSSTSDRLALGISFIATYAEELFSTASHTVECLPLCPPRTCSKIS